MSEIEEAQRRYNEQSRRIKALKEVKLNYEVPDGICKEWRVKRWEIEHPNY